MKLSSIYPKWLICSLLGHPCEPTGRHGVILKEWKCLRCGEFYVSHPDHGNRLIKRDEAAEKIFQEGRDYTG